MNSLIKVIMVSAALLLILLVLVPAGFANEPAKLSEERSTEQTLSIQQQLTHLDNIRLEDQSQFRAGLASLRQLPLSEAADIEYLMLLNAYEQALLGQYDRVLPVLTQLLDASSDTTMIIKARMLAVNVLLLSNNHERAFSYFEKLTNNISAITDAELMAQVIVLVMFTYNELERYDLSLLYLRYIDFNSIPQKLACRINVIALEAKFKKIDSVVTEKETNIVIDECVAAREYIPANIARHHLMQYFLKNNEAEKVLAIYQQNLKEIENTHYPVLISQVLVLAAQAQLQLNNVQQASTLANQALLKAKSSPNNVALVEAYATLYQIAKQQQNYALALQHLEQQYQVEEEFNASKAKQQAAYHTVKSEIELKNQRINLLDRDNELLFLQKSIYQEEVKNSRLLLLLAALIGFIALVLAYRGLTGRKRFKLMAEYDQLTGISNRYHFNNEAKQALKYCQAKHLPVAMILFDLDHFKTINDQFGHATGDWALQQIVRVCKQFMRSNDIFGRIGGEEFVIMMPGCELDKATLLAEICRDAIASIDCNTSEHQFSLSASFGVSGNVVSGYDIKLLLADADKAMYEAKNRGRNKVVEYQKTDQ
ncbi:diguanylate cyclase domain-containing protein [Arsukibacterium sp.]|uniref:diguanylate cyclase domain-containing protein n=1 Tax=Arsukibacterium sp. TaxID=1977258 RepID=UPI0035687340